MTIQNEMTNAQRGELKQAMLLAAEQHFRKVVVPLFYERADGKIVIAGSGTIFLIGERYFILTADHVLRDLPDPAALMLPTDPNLREIRSIKASNRFFTDADELDTAALEVTDEDTLAFMRNGWGALTLDDVAVPSREGLFVVTGFPESLKDDGKGFQSARLAMAYTHIPPSLPDDARKPIRADVDVFFDYSKDAITIANDEIESPVLPGASGGPIWEYRNLGDAVWSPHSSLKVVAIQSACLHGKYCRGKLWIVAARLLQKIDGQIEEIVRNKFHL